jgi:hypothetical protein
MSRPHLQTEIGRPGGPVGFGNWAIGQMLRYKVENVSFHDIGCSVSKLARHSLAVTPSRGVARAAHRGRQEARD